MKKISDKLKTLLKDKFLRFCVVLCLAFGLTLMVWDFIDVPVTGVKDLIVVLFQWLSVVILASAGIVLLTINRYVFAVLFPLLTILTSVGAYYRATMGVTVTPQVIELMAVNDTRTCMEVVSPMLIIVVLIAASASAYVARVRFQSFKPNIVKGPIIYVCAIVLMCIPGWSSRRDSFMNRLPFSIYYSIDQYMVQRTEIQTHRDTFDNVDVTCDDDSLTVIVIIGESLRADHLALNGYSRQTTPRLSADTAVISFKNIHSEPYFTHRSIPRILTRADSLNPDLASTEQSFITLFNRAGYRTTWISNQDTAQPYVYFMHEADSLIQISATSSLYSFNKWLDRDIIKPLTGVLTESNPKSLCVIHTIGSHWWYPNHTTAQDEAFKPVVKSKVVSACTHDEIINSYDNTIVATDAFLSEVTDMLRDKRAVVLFISDHGECLGEGGVYLHAQDAPQLHNPACLVWFSDKFLARYPEKIKAMRKNRDKTYSTDQMFYTVCDLGSLSSSVLLPQMSLCD